MTISSVNSPISLQESQLLQLIQQQAAKALSGTNTAQTQAQTAASGQNVPSDGTDGQIGTTGNQTDVTDAAAQNLDPDLSPENISALLLELQTQQASLDTTLLLGGSASGSGGKTLVDYLTNPGTVGNDVGADSTASCLAPEDLGLVDYLE